MGKSIPSELITPDKVLILADRIDALAGREKSNHKLEVRKDYALLTRIYVGGTLKIASTVQGGELRATPPDTKWKEATGIMLLGLAYRPADIEVPEFEPYISSFRFLSDLDAQQ